MVRRPGPAPTPPVGGWSACPPWPPRAPRGIFGSGPCRCRASRAGGAGRHGRAGGSLAVLGQSNMQWTDWCGQSDIDLSAADHAQIRMFNAAMTCPSRRTMWRGVGRLRSFHGPRPLGGRVLLRTLAAAVARCADRSDPRLVGGIHRRGVDDPFDSRVDAGDRSDPRTVRAYERAGPRHRGLHVHPPRRRRMGAGGPALDVRRSGARHRRGHLVPAAFRPAPGVGRS